MKSIKDYLHLYLGCDCQRMGQTNDSELFRLTGISWDGTQKIWWAYFEDKEDCYSVIDDVFPILRPLSDMTDKEEKEMISTQDNVKLDGFPQILLKTDSGETFRYMLSKGFDLFNLIEEGLAIDKTTLK